MSKFTNRLHFAAKLSVLHFIISCAIAAVMALVVFKIWYPYPFNYMLGGLQLFLMVVSIDVICGPILTFILSNPQKSKREMLIDFSLIGLIQLSALLYGLHTVYIARPIYYAFDADRFVTVTVAQLESEQLAKVPEEFKNFPKMGPKMISLKTPEKIDLDDFMKYLFVDAIAKPERWVSFNEKDLEDIKGKKIPVSALFDLPANKDKKDLINKAVQKTNIPVDKLYYLPFTCDRNLDWSALLDENGEIVGYVDADGFQ